MQNQQKSGSKDLNEQQQLKNDSKDLNEQQKLSKSNIIQENKNFTETQEINLKDITSSKNISNNWIISNLINSNNLIEDKNLISDVGITNWNKYAINKEKTLKEVTSIFCDNIMLIGFVEGQYIEMDSKGSIKLKHFVTSFLNSYIRNTFKDNNLILTSKGAVTIKNPMCLNGADCHTRTIIKNNYKEEIKKLVNIPNSTEKLNTENKELYVIQYKVELADLDFKDLLLKLPQVLKDLEEKNIFLKDLDITKDFKHSFNCEEVINYMLTTQNYKIEGESGNIKNGIIQKDTYGGSCVAVLKEEEKEEITTRSKIYNKYVCQLTSAGVNYSNGNHLYSLFNSGHKRLDKAFKKAYKAGLSRIEITLYTKKVFSYEYYEELINKFISSCGTTFYKTPFKNTFKALEEKIKNTVLFVNLDKLIFSFGYWYNSKTRRLYGVESKFKSEDRKNLNNIINYIVAGYSFIKRPCNVIKYSFKDGLFKMEHRTYIKSTGDTLISKGKKFYIKLKDIDNKTFKKRGLNHGDIKFKISTKKHNHNKPPLYGIKQVKNYIKLEMLSPSKVNKLLEKLKDIEQFKIIKENIKEETQKYNNYINKLVQEEEEKEYIKLQIQEIITQFNNGQKLTNLETNTTINIYAYKKINTKYGESYLMLCKIDNNLNYSTYYVDGYNKAIINNNKNKLLKHSTITDTYYMGIDYKPLYKLTITGTKYINNNKCNNYKIKTLYNLDLPVIKETKKKLLSNKTPKIKLYGIGDIKFKNCLEMEKLENSKRYIITNINKITHRNKPRYMFKILTEDGEPLQGIYKSSYFLEEELNKLDITDKINQILIRTTSPRTTPNNNKALRCYILS